MGVTGVLNLSHGGRKCFATTPWNRHDLAGALQLLKHFGAGDLVLGDRAFNSCELVALLLLSGAHSLMRLHQKRARKLDWRKGRRIGRQQRIVGWQKPRYRANGLLSPGQWPRSITCCSSTRVKRYSSFPPGLPTGMFPPNSTPRGKPPSMPP
jgi:hypothetical protein